MLEFQFLVNLTYLLKTEIENSLKIIFQKKTSNFVYDDVCEHNFHFQIFNYIFKSNYSIIPY